MAQTPSYITTKISKHLLTPCRRVGLPKVKKTPTIQTAENVEEVKEETPKRQVGLVQKKQIELKNKVETNTESLIEKTVSRKLIHSNGIEKESEEIPLNEIKKVEKETCKEEFEEDQNKRKRKRPKRQMDLKKETKNLLPGEENLETKESITIKDSKICKKSSNDEDQKKNEVSTTKNDVKNDKDSTLLKTKQQETRKRKCPEDEGRTKAKQHDYESVLQKLKNEEEELIKDLGRTDDRPKLEVCKADKKKLRKSLSMKKTMSSDCEGFLLKGCVVFLSPLESKEEFNIPTVSETEIMDLQAQIKDKEKLLEDLKRAANYKKKHNLKELEKLTSLWKQGCIAALTDLLPQLQSYTKIDMQELLNNLKIPKEKISVTTEGDLI